MENVTIREYTAEDIPALTSLWAEAFGDSEELIHGFFRLLPDMGTGVAAELDGRVVGAAYAVTGLELRGMGKKCPVGGYLYGVAVEKPYRNRGIGAAVVRGAAEAAKKRGADFLCTLPAEESLYGWYEGLLGTVPALFCTEKRVMPQSTEMCMKLSATEYLLWREALLRDRVRMYPSIAFMEFQRLLCEEYGGGLYACGSGICAAYVEDGVCTVHDLITPEGAESIAASVTAALGAKEGVYFLPSEAGKACLAAEPDSVPRDCVWNLSLD